MIAANFQTPPPVLRQHVEETAFLWLLRDKAIADPHYSLSDLTHLDSRVEAHIDGLRIADDSAWDMCKKALKSHEAGEMFAAAVLSLEGSDGARLAEVLEVASESDEAARGVVSAIGWVGPEFSDQWIPSMLRSNSLSHLRVGLAGLAVRREDMATEIETAVKSSDMPLRARALRAIGETKVVEGLQQLREQLQADDEACRFWAAWSAVLLGENSVAESLKSFVNFSTPFAHRAIQLIPRVLDPTNAQGWLRELAQDETTRRFALIGCGVTGDPTYIPTLISQMSVPEQARVAGEAFSMITGVDLAYDDLDMDQPEDFEVGPTEDPEDEDVDLDPDEDLPWPNQELIQKWWDEHGRNYQAGRRYLCGQPISQENCRRVLIEGFQRQRIAAAFELALLNPDEPLFEWRAPGFRQQEWLGLKKSRPRT